MLRSATIVLATLVLAPSAQARDLRQVRVVKVIASLYETSIMFENDPQRHAVANDRILQVLLQAKASDLRVDVSVEAPDPEEGESIVSVTL